MINLDLQKSRKIKIKIKIKAQLYWKIINKLFPLFTADILSIKDFHELERLEYQKSIILEYG